MLGVADFGRFSAALAFAQMVTVCVDSGMGQLVAKDIAKGNSKGLAEVDQIFSWRIALILAVSVLLPLGAHLFYFSIRGGWLALALGPCVQLIIMADFFCWIFKGALRPSSCAFLQIATSSLLLILCLVALAMPHPLFYLVVAHGITGIVTTGLGLFMLSRSLHRMRIVTLPRQFFLKTLPNIYKLGGILILSIAFTRLDLLLVTRYCGMVEAGLFGSVGRVFDGLRMIPMAVYGVYLPVFSAAHDRADILRYRFKSAYILLFTAAVFISLIGYVFAEPLFIHVLGSQYLGSVPYFKSMVWSSILVFSNILMMALLYALNDHQIQAIAIGAGLVVELTLDLVLLPKYGTLAAVGARLFAEGIIFGFLAYGIARRQILSVGDLLFRPAFITAASLLVFILMRSSPVYSRLFMATGTYLGFLWVVYPVQTTISREWSNLKNAFL